MFYRTLLVTAPLALGAAVYWGAIPIQSLSWSGASYSKVVPATPADVQAALAAIPLGSSDEPTAQRTANADGFTWSIPARGKTVWEMKVVIVPLNGGQSARVDAWVNRGDAPNVNLPVMLASTDNANRILSGNLDLALNPLAPPAERLSDQALAAKRGQVQGLTLMTLAMANPHGPERDEIADYLANARSLD